MAAALLGQLEDDLDVRRLLGVPFSQGDVGVDAGQRLLDLFKEFVGGRPVADDPVDLFPVLVDEQIGRRRVDFEPLEDGVADLVAAAGAVDDEILVEEIGVFGVVVELLDQQFAAPSATRVEVDEDELVLFLGLGQRLVEGSREDRGRLGGGERGDEEEAGERGDLFHTALLGNDSSRPAYDFRERNAIRRPHLSIRRSGDQGCVPGRPPRPGRCPAPSAVIV
jgi:hypothetical protein